MDDIWVVEEYTYKVVNSKPVVVLFLRNYNNPEEFTTFEWHNNRPYFYCPVNEKDRKLPYNCEYDDEVIIDAFGREVCKVYTNIPNDVPNLRGLFTFTDMADFLFEKRCVIDNSIKYAIKIENDKPMPVNVDKILQPRIVYYDIEVLSPVGIFPDPIEAKFPIISIQVMDNYTEKILVFTNQVPQTSDNCHIACNSEQDLFKLFLAYLKEINPDVISGWNSNSYDLPYLIRRSYKLGINAAGIGRIGKVFCEYNPADGKFNTRVKGRSTLDMLEAFKKYNAMNSQRESYALKSVSADYGIEYPDLGPILDKVLSEQRYEEFIQYCKNDVIALQNIDNKVKLFNFYENLRYITGTRLDDVLYNSRLIEMLLMHEGIKPMPTKSKVAEVEDKFKGALVLEPPAGLHEYVGCVDLAALYPTCMRAFPERTCPDAEYKVIEVLELVVNKREELRELRKQGKGDHDLKTREDVFKAIANSFYGVVGSPAFRLYKRECAESVTSIAREINMFIHEKLRELNYSVLYSDTDSSFFSKIDDFTKGLEIQDYLNKKLIDWGHDHDAKVVFSLKFEKLYKRILFKKDENGIGVKKKYCGYLIWSEDSGEVSELNYKGLELKRSDQSDITRECLKFFLEHLLIIGDENTALQFVKEKYNQVKSGDINILEISIPKAIRKVKYNTDNAWVRGINTARDEYNYIIQEGVKPRLLYLKQGEICIDEDFDTSLIKDLINYNVMAEKTIKKKMESYIWSIGYNWDNLVHGQKSLDDWF